MAGYKRGTIVLLPFPFSDQSSGKIRPAVVVNPNYPSEDLLVVAVTSMGETLRPGEFAIQYWREAGLIHPSFAKRAVASVSGHLIRKQIGVAFREKYQAHFHGVTGGATVNCFLFFYF